jgi:hypothetical protein
MKKIFVISFLTLSTSFLTLSAQTKSKAKSTNTTTAGTPAPAAVYNGPKGCPSAMDADEFSGVNKTFKDNDDADEILGAAKKAAVAHCFSADQVKSLMHYLRTDDNKFEFFKVVYPHIYDQKNYVNIGDTFKDASYKDKIRVYVNSLE